MKIYAAPGFDNITPSDFMELPPYIENHLVDFVEICLRTG